jgi:predicted nucleic acid-binding protein
LKILVDTSVWIDFFNGVPGAPQMCLRNVIEAEETVCISPYILTETLQGFKDDKEFEIARANMLQLPILDLKTPESYIGAAELYRICRKRGLTIRKTADCVIAQTAIEHGVALLHNDKDFDQIASVSPLKIYPA